MNTGRSFLLAMSDGIGFILGFLGFILLAFPQKNFMEQVMIHAPSFIFLTLLWIIVLYVFNFYDIQKSRPNVIFLRNFGIAGTIMLVIGIIFFYLNPITAIAPKSNLLIFISISLLIILGLRRIIYSATKNNIHTRCAIICSDPLGQQLADTLRNHSELGFLCIGIYPHLPAFLESNPDASLVIIDTQEKQDLTLLENILKTNRAVIDITEAYETILYKIPVNLITYDWIIHSLKK